eukprot:CAMPEP_0184378648 /NCGR_PEP_ID=MMETSP0007-20130409/3251_1 /TAXON_ID=97485 /ORGANISM="Prymnesium parvum, Strain Texoma1" /LENGTH=66 /DNA_ID=CAMNT_0026723029 /DNA_START=249 /DNA_END=445 /DNA_ORIENTATION=+
MLFMAKELKRLSQHRTECRNGLRASGLNRRRGRVGRCADHKLYEHQKIGRRLTRVEVELGLVAHGA